MELLLVRHALPVRRESVVGPADPELSEAGHRQAQHLAEYLSTETLAAVYSSPLRRARETAGPLAAAHRTEVIVDDDVAEWDRQSASYVPVEEMKAENHPRWQALVAGRWEGDEDSPAVFAARVVSAIGAIAARHPSTKVAVVCHGGVINAYLADVLGVNTDVGFFYPNYTSIHRVAVASSGERSIITMNETAHLRGTGLPIGLLQDGTNT